jgi:hypothetical protein
MSEWKLLTRAKGLKAAMLVLQGVALVTVGVGATLFAGIAGMVPGMILDGFGVSDGIAALVVVLGGVIAWLAAAWGVGRAFLKSLGHILKLRVPFGAAVIGADGVAFTKPLRREFIAFHDVSSLQIEGDEVVLGLANGEKVRFLVSDAKALHGALRRALSRFTKAQSSAIAELALEDETDVESWLDRVRRLLSHAAEYRGAAVTADALERVAKDPTARADQRIGAALALAGDEARRVRVRVAVEDVANAELAEAMDAALEDSLTEEAAKRAVGAKRS